MRFNHARNSNRAENRWNLSNKLTLAVPLNHLFSSMTFQHGQMKECEQAKNIFVVLFDRPAPSLTAVFRQLK